MINFLYAGQYNIMLVLNICYNNTYDYIGCRFSWCIYRYTSTVGNCCVLASFIWNLLMELEKVMVLESIDAGSISYQYLKAPAELIILLKLSHSPTNVNSS